MDSEKGRVCVTGGTGYLASSMIKALLENGYSVNTTVRFPIGSKDVSFLTSLPGASGKLKIFQANLSEPGSFREAIEGCKGVIHMATPVDFEESEPEEEICKRAIDGAVGILKVCLDSKTVQRVIYTSSAAAVMYSGADNDEMNESFWSDVDYVRAKKPFGVSYITSKTLTEKAVLEFAEQNGLNIATINPSYVLGPFICPKLPGSVRISLAFVFGDEVQYKYLINAAMVHVEDVVRAHIFLLERSGLKGRYICSAEQVSLEKMSQFLSAKYPEMQIPRVDSLKGIEGHKFPVYSSKKLLDVGFKYKYGLDEMFEDAIECCKEKGYL